LAAERDPIQQDLFKKCWMVCFHGSPGGAEAHPTFWTGTDLFSNFRERDQFKGFARSAIRRDIFVVGE
jgi:hypothetical protein